jgi:hypothetical protein
LRVPSSRCRNLMAQKILERSGTGREVAPSPARLSVYAGVAGVSLAVAEVLEILEPRTIAPIPGATAAVPGLLNYQGTAVTVVDLGAATGGTPLLGQPHRLVVSRWRGHLIALAVSGIGAPGAAGPGEAGAGEPASRLLDTLFGAHPQPPRTT